MSEDPIYFNGQRLPPLRPGNAWGFRLYPGGRAEVRQCKPERLQALGDAKRSLDAGNRATVRLEFAEMLVAWRVASRLKAGA